MERSQGEVELEGRVQKLLDEASKGLFALGAEFTDSRLGPFKVFVRPSDDAWALVFFQGSTVLFGLSLADEACRDLDAETLQSLFENRQDEIHETLVGDRLKKMERDLLPVLEEELRRLLEGRIDGATLDELSVDLEDLRELPSHAEGSTNGPWPLPAMVVTHLERDEICFHLPLDFFDPGRAVDLTALAEGLAEVLA